MAIINIQKSQVTRLLSHTKENRKNHDTEDHSEYGDGNSDKGHRLSLRK